MTTRQTIAVLGGTGQEGGALALRCNAAVQHGVENLRSHGAHAILILSIDPPLIEASDLREIASIDEEHRVVVRPNKHYTGTNAIFLPPATSPGFCFGTGS